MKIIYMGTPEIAAVILEDLVSAGYDIAAVVTQPDKPRGRGKELGCSEVKETALAHGLAVYQPERVKEEAFLDELKRLKPDLIVVAAFGQLLPKQILELPKYGCINVHASLLPKYRGASPIQWAILDGERVTGVTIMYMAEGLDTGDMITKELVEIAPDETGGSLHDKLAGAGCIALRRAIGQIEGGTAVRTPQDNTQATYVGMLKKEMGYLDFSRPAVELERRVRGLNPWPSAYTGLDGRLLKLWRCEVCGEPSAQVKQRIREEKWECGTVVETGRDFFSVLTGDGLLVVRELQLEGKRRMSAEEFLRGCPLKAGEVLK
ncbi:MAG: methionyl-tRNA formyltransferase [Lachnospiraceae bacterium]|nr:methionyl-tRNA formyltransferase [Lachnospiraceae bacterium]